MSAFSFNSTPFLHSRSIIYQLGNELNGYFPTMYDSLEAKLEFLST